MGDGILSEEDVELMKAVNDGYGKKKTMMMKVTILTSRPSKRGLKARTPRRMPRQAGRIKQTRPPRKVVHAKAYAVYSAFKVFCNHFLRVSCKHSPPALGR